MLKKRRIDQTGRIGRDEQRTKRTTYTIQSDDDSLGEVQIADEVVAIIAATCCDGSRRRCFDGGQRDQRELVSQALV